MLVTRFRKLEYHISVIGFSYAMAGKRQHYLYSTTLAGLGPGSSVNARDPETLHPPLASVEV